jgi:nucleotide-binding universal stress UspA family protein
MGLILCATRGGEASYRSQQEAISLAKERGDEIVFLYILNLGFLDKSAAPVVVNVEHELEQMGRFFLLMAKERAMEQGVAVRSVIRRGEVREEIIGAAQEEGATLVILGQPAGELSAFEMSSLREFMAEIEEVTGAETVLV